MRNTKGTLTVIVFAGLVLAAGSTNGQDWPQWRGPNRDNRLTGFKVPAAWPKELSKKWKTPVGLGDASPSLVGDKLYVFTRQGGDEVAMSLDARSGDVLWKDKYMAETVTGGSKDHPGPRSTPAVGEGKVCTLGVGGVLSCYDAATGKLVWRNESKGFPAPRPDFYTGCSPIIHEGVCIAHLGGGGKGAILALDLATGEEKWRWDGDPPAYGSPVLATIEGTKQIISQTMRLVVGIDAKDGKLLWQIAAPVSGGAKGTPMVDGQTVIYAGQGIGTLAVRIEKEGDKFVVKPLWNVKDAPSMFNTPVLKDGLLFGLSSANRFYCMDAQTGKTLWTDATPRGNCGAILDAGPVLLALTNNSELIAMQPSNKEYVEVAKYKVADQTGNSGPWAYPIISGNRIFVKDRENVTLWTMD
jgi:outer membrane protein assembly factor BamB